VRHSKQTLQCLSTSLQYLHTFLFRRPASIFHIWAETKYKSTLLSKSQNFTNNQIDSTFSASAGAAYLRMRGLRKSVVERKAQTETLATFLQNGSFRPLIGDSCSFSKDETSLTSSRPSFQRKTADAITCY
jgi:hypothetical protein